MAWSSPRTWVANELVTATIMNTHVRDNLNYLLSGRPLDFAAIGTQQSTASTSYVDIDGTNLTVTVTPAGTGIIVIGAVMLTVDNTASNTGQVQIFGDNGAGASTEQPIINQNLTHTLSLAAYYSGLTPATAYTFSLQYKAGTGTIYANNSAQGNNTYLMAFEY